MLRGANEQEKEVPTKQAWVVTGVSRRRDGLLMVVRADNAQEAYEEVAKVTGEDLHYDVYNEEDDYTANVVLGRDTELAATKLEENSNMYEAVQW